MDVKHNRCVSVPCIKDDIKNYCQYVHSAIYLWKDGVERTASQKDRVIFSGQHLVVSVE